MSQFSLDGALFTEDGTRLTSNAVTTLYTASSGSTPISSIICCATTGSPTVTITVETPGGVSRTLWKATAPTTFQELYFLPSLYLLRIQSSSATGDVDVHVTHGVPAAARLRP